MALNEINRLRLARINQRFAARRGEAAADAATARAAFEAAFIRIRGTVLVPLFEDLGGELAKAGHTFEIQVDGHARRPSVVFAVQLRGAQPGNRNRIGLFVQHDGLGAKSEVIPYLELQNEFDLGRFQSPDEMTREVLEQMLVDALEHMIVCNE